MRPFYQVFINFIAALPKVVLALLLLAGLQMCKPKKIKVRTLPAMTAYNLSKPYVINLHGEMNEISGLHFFLNDTKLLCYLYLKLRVFIVDRIGKREKLRSRLGSDDLLSFTMENKVIISLCFSTSFAFIHDLGTA